MSRRADTANADAEVTFKREETRLVAAFADSSAPVRPSQDFAVSDRPGLKSTPMGSAVSNATDRYSLPEPALAVRNLVRRCSPSPNLRSVLSQHCCVVRIATQVNSELS